jgi:Mg-chelatase subunit ChlD
MPVPPLPTRRISAALPVVLALLGACREAPPDDVLVADPADPTSFYVAEGTEGIGASIAILLDQSGSMSDAAPGDPRPKYLVAREAIAAMLEATDSLVAARPDFPVQVGLFAFSGRVSEVHPIAPWNGTSLREALVALPVPDGATAIGDAMFTARRALYRAGLFRKYLLVVTDGENTAGRDPRRVAREIHARGQGAVQMYFVAFDVDPARFDFLAEVRGEVLGAGDARGLRSALTEIYQGRILAELDDYGEGPAPSTPAPQPGDPR